MTDLGLFGFGLSKIFSISKYAPHVAINVGLLGERLGASGRHLITNHLLAGASMKHQERKLPCPSISLPLSVPLQ